MPEGISNKYNVPTDSDLFKSLSSTPWYAKTPVPQFSKSHDKETTSDRKMKKREAKRMLKRIKAELDNLNN